MIIKQIIDEDFVNYKQPSMLILFPTCSWKCGEEVCHNREISNLPDIEMSIDTIRPLPKLTPQLKINKSAN